MPVLLNFALIAIMTVVAIIGGTSWARLARRFGWRISERTACLLLALMVVITNGRSLLRTDPSSIRFAFQLLALLMFVGVVLYRAWQAPKQV